MPEIELKPDQERVKNLLTDTVTLLCRNSLTFRDRLRIEGLLGVSIDNSDVFFVHISENFEQNSSEKAPAEDAEASMFTAPESPAKPSRRPRESPCPSPSRQSQLSPASSPAQVKSEPAEDVDDLLIVEEPKPEVFADRARQTSMVAGQRRAARRREHSPLVQHHQGGWDDMGEPAAKRHMSTDSDSENNGGGQGSGFGQVDENVGWPDMVTDFNQGHMFHQDPGGSSFDTTTPGCSTWPTTLATQQQTQDTMMNRTFARNPASMLTQDNVRQALLEYVVNPFMCHKVLAFRIAWTTKNLPEDTIWQHIFTQSRNAFENDIKSYGGIAFFITAATATVSNQTKRRDVCPALGYFVVAETPEFKEAPMYIRLRGNPYGGVLKLMNDRGVKPGDNRNLVWLSLLLKDNVDSGYVLGKMAAAGLHTNSVVRMFVHSPSFREPLLRAKGILESLGFPIEFEYF